MFWWTVHSTSDCCCFSLLYILFIRLFCCANWLMMQSKDSHDKTQRELGKPPEHVMKFLLYQLRPTWTSMITQTGLCWFSTGLAGGSVLLRMQKLWRTVFLNELDSVKERIKKYTSTQKIGVENDLYSLLFSPRLHYLTKNTVKMLILWNRITI